MLLMFLFFVGSQLRDIGQWNDKTAAIVVIVSRMLGGGCGAYTFYRISTHSQGKWYRLKMQSDSASQSPPPLCEPLVDYLSPEPSAEFRGLGGWLVVLFLGLILSIVGGAVDVYIIVSSYTSGQVSSLTDFTSSKFVPGLGQALVFSLVGDLLLIPLIGYSIYLFFSKKRLFPSIAISCIGINLIVVLFAGYKFSGIWDSSLPVLSALISVLVWIPYLLKS
jgi:multisubunit Na+/H+ antiporter MnhC subunit